jgi:hypothetical protein
MAVLQTSDVEATLLSLSAAFSIVEQGISVEESSLKFFSLHRMDLNSEGW